MKNLVSLFLCLCMLLTTAAFGLAETAVDTAGILPKIAGEGGTTYANLFEVIVNDTWTQVWNEYIGAIVGEENAPAATAMLQSSSKAIRSLLQNRMEPARPIPMNIWVSTISVRMKP